MLIFHKGHADTIQVYSVTVMTHVKALQAGHSSQGTSEPIAMAQWLGLIISTFLVQIRGGPERMGPRPPPWVPLLKNPIMVAVSFPPV